MTENDSRKHFQEKRRTDTADSDCNSEQAQTASAETADECNQPASGAVQTQKSRKKSKKKRNLWALKITIVTLFLSAFISFLTEITSSADNIIVTVILLLFLIVASILFDGIGVAVTSCDITPIVSMASKKVYGAKTAMWLVKNNEKVANVCNDVIGDIFGIISGACGAAIVVKLVMTLDESWQRWLTIAMSSIISALTIGGKAFLKNIAISNSKEFVMFVARIIGVFHPEERKRKKKQAEKKKKYAATENGKTDDRSASVQSTTDAKNRPVQKHAVVFNGYASNESLKPESVTAKPDVAVANDDTRAGDGQPAASDVGGTADKNTSDDEIR